MRGAALRERARYLRMLVIVGDAGEVTARHVAGLQLVEVLAYEEHLEGQIHPLPASVLNKSRYDLLLQLQSLSYSSSSSINPDLYQQLHL